MSADLINALGKWAVVIIVLAGCFILLYTGKSTDTQPWTAIGLIVGWVVRDSAGNAATTNAVKAIAAYQAPPPPGTV